MDQEHSPHASQLGQENTHTPRRLPAARSENPELWDLEREYERRRTEQLDEVWAKSARVVELMARVEALEPLPALLAERERELAALREATCRLEGAQRELEERHRALGESLRASEESCRSVQDESERRRAEIERLGGEIRGLRDTVARLDGELAERWREHERVAAERRDEREAFARELDGSRRSLEQARSEHAARIAALEHELRERSQALEGKHRWAEALAADLDATRAELAARSATLLARDAELSKRDAELATASADRERTAEALAAARSDYSTLEATWRSTLEQLELARAERRKQDSHLAATLAALEEIRPMIHALEAKLQTHATS